MALYQAFTSLTTGTRNSSTDEGAIYYLNGNTTNGRLNISLGATWIVGDNTTVVYDGNTGHSFMSGTIRAKDFKIIAIPNNNGRCDFGNGSCSWDIEDSSFIYYGNGDIYNHLEDDSRASVFRGETKLIFEMDSGFAYTQFSSKEYENITFDVRDGNNAEIRVYPARSTSGHTSLTGFRTIGLNEMILLKGTQSTSHGRIYDPTYEGVANNLLSMRTDSSTLENRAIEYFSLDVTNIANNNARALVKDSNNTILFNNTLTVSNLTPVASDGTTPLRFYSGKNVILCEVRRINNTSSTTRNLISYKIRRAGYFEINIENFAMNNPIVIKEMKVDSNYSNSTIGTAINNVQELYDEIKNLLVAQISVEDMISVII